MLTNTRGITLVKHLVFTFSVSNVMCEASIQTAYLKTIQMLTWKLLMV